MRNLRQEIFSYFIFGVMTTIVNVVVFDFLHRLLHWDYRLANLLAIFLSILFAYLTNKRWVFQLTTRKGQDLVKEVSQFFLFRFVVGGIDMLLLALFVSIVGIKPTISKLMVQVIVVILNYVFSKWIVFKIR